MRYELDFSQKKYINGEPVYRIKALQTFLCKASLDIVHAGDHGGWISESSDLYQDGTAWVFDESIVLGGVQIKDDVVIEEESVIIGKTFINGAVCISGSVIENSKVEICSGKVVWSLILDSVISASNSDIFDSDFKETDVSTDNLSSHQMITDGWTTWSKVIFDE